MAQISLRHLHPNAPTLIPNDYVVASTRITGNYSNDIAKARAYVDGNEKGIGGSFNPDGTFSYWIGSGVKIDSKLFIEGIDSNNNVVTNKIKVNIIENMEEN